MDILSKINSLTELHLLRQDNLPLYATVNSRAFHGENVLDIPRFRYEEILIEALDEFRGRGLDLKRDVESYIRDMVGGKREGGWIGTSTDRGRSHERITLQPAGSRVLRFLNHLSEDDSRIGQTALADLVRKQDQLVARLNGDVAQEIAALKAERDALDRKIERLEKGGAKPLTEHEKTNEIYAVAEQVSSMISGVSRAPGRHREYRKILEQIYVDQSYKAAQVSEEFYSLKERWRSTAEYNLLQEFSSLSFGNRSEDLQRTLNVLADHAAEILPVEHVKTMRNFLPKMIEISHSVLHEEGRSWKGYETQFTDPDFAERRNDMMLVSSTYAKIKKIHHALAPSMRDKRVGDVQLAMARGADLGPLLAIGLTESPPVQEPIRDAAQELPPRENEAALQTARDRLAQDRYLNHKNLRKIVSGYLETADSVPLSKILKDNPIRYGIHEVVSWISFALTFHPATFGEDRLAQVSFEANNRLHRARIPDPVFTLTGEPGMGADVEGLQDAIINFEKREFT